MRRKILTLFLVFSMVLTFVPEDAFVFASELINDALSNKDIVEVSKKSYALAPGVTEYEYITNNKEMSKQQVGHIMEIKPGSSSEVRVGYNDYNIPAIASGNNWKMLEPTQQAENAENRANIDVVGVVNGDFFNMANGCPAGYTVMQGTVIRDVDSTCYWIDNKGNSHIASNKAEVKTVCEKEEVEVQEAIGGGAILIENGERTSAGGDYGDIANPRTVVGLKSDGTVIFYMVDGRQAPYSVGMTYGDLADIMFNLDCVQAINIDGGGSSAFATQREGEPDNNIAGLTLRSNPSDGYERRVSTCLMVISNAASDGVFDHATITPSQEVYTPGSKITFEAKGVDKAGKPAMLPTESLTWEVAEGNDIGTINSNGEFIGNDSETGSVTIVLKHNGNVVGTTTVEMQWPDKLGFTNNSVSLDFGETSDMTFTPTYKGRTVNYKDGDFVWELDESNLTYKYSANMEQYYTPWWQAAAFRWSQLTLVLTGKTDSNGDVNLEYEYEGILTYESKYHSERNISVQEDGSIQVNEKLTHKGAKLYSIGGGSIAAGSLLKDNITENFEIVTLSDGKAYGIKGLVPEKEVSFSLGKFVNNTYTADENTSVKGKVRVSLKSDSKISNTVELVVGMEPYMLMDFEDKVSSSGDIIKATDYWKTKVSQGKTGQLSSEDVHNYRLWVRNASNESSFIPTDNGQNAIVSVTDEAKAVRFGEYAFKMGYDFRNFTESAVAVAEFGFSGDVYINAIQPTKIGMWVNVPEDRANDNSVLKAVLKGGATPAALGTAYMTLNDDGTTTYTDGYQLNGTASYVTYRSYDTEGNVSGESLSDWAGKGWTWVEADISHFQMPVDLCRGYTVRITSPQNCTKDKGYIYIDNLQFIYGTNTNDINNPVIDAIIERNTNTTLSDEASTELKNGAVAFEVLYNDSADTDKYATGIDTNSVKIFVDGEEYTHKDGVDITENSLTVPAVTLTNGEHNVEVIVKDRYGNETKATRTIVINDDAGQNALVGIEPQMGNPEINKKYSIDIVSKTGQPIDSATLSVKLYQKYLDKVEIVSGAGYEVTKTVDTENKLVNVTITKTSEEVNRGNILATINVGIPGDTGKEEYFVFSVPKAKYIEAGGTATFSIAEQSKKITAAYSITSGDSIKDFETIFTVKDNDGNPVSGVRVVCDNEDLSGLTDENGQLKNVFNLPTTKAHTVYAIDNDGSRTWNSNLVVCDWATDGDGAPFGIQSNATKNADTTSVITWMSSIGASTERGKIRYAKVKADVAATTPIGVDSKLLAFAEGNTGNAMRLHTAKLQNLEADTTYYYQVGDGEKWSDILSFKTASANKNAITNFVIMGDIQTDSTANLAAVLNKLADDNKEYAFAIQTGDAIDGVNNFSQWRALFNTLNAKSLSSPMVHTLGNHEYYGAAKGEISTDIFALPESEQGSFYSLEYGSVYVGVINNGGDLEKALNELKIDAKASDCQWKILVMHEPVYGTTEDMSESERTLIADTVREAGIEFVFGGDHHSYARTYPMLGTEILTEDSINATVYFVSGDLSSKTNEFKKKEEHVVAIPHSEYQGCYLSVEANYKSFKVTAYDVNGNVLDTYERVRTDCQLGNHKASSESVYDMSNGTIRCSVCNEYVDSAKVGWSGLLQTKDSTVEVPKYVILSEGKPVKDKFTMIVSDMYHSGTDGYAYKAVINDPTTCVKGGYKTYYCAECRKSQRIGDYIMPKGHDWDADHVCHTCGFKGIDINTLEAGFIISGIEKPVNTNDPNKYVPKYYYATGGVRPSTYIKYNGQKLTWSNDANVNEDGSLRDLYVSWPNDKTVGTAKVSFEGKGNYYGTRTLDYVIVPNDVKNLKATKVDDSTVKLSWDKALGAGYYRLYECDAQGNTVKEINKNITSTIYTLKELDPDKQYYFKMASSTNVNNVIYNCPKWSNIVGVKTSEMTKEEDVFTVIKGIDAAVGGNQIEAKLDDTDKYMFLPSVANLTDIDIHFGVKAGTTGDIILTGNKGKATLLAKDDYKGKINIATLSNKDADGNYEITISIGDYKTEKLIVVQMSEIPTIYLTSADLNKDRQWVDSSKENEATGSMVMVGADGKVVYNGNLKQIKARGNSTFAHYPKKAYQIKLNTASDLLGTSENVKTWVLLANYGDATLMHDKFFKDLAKEMNMDYVASTGWANLYYDGEYRGVYQLSEKNSIGKTGINITDLEAKYEETNANYGTDMIIETGTNDYGQNIQFTIGLTDPSDITGGYLIELNHQKWDEASGFMTKQGVGFNVKSPEWASEAAVRYISEYYQEFEDAVFAVDGDGNHTGYNSKTDKYYSDYVDVDSLVKIFLIQELGLNPDGFISSLYFYKDVNGKLIAGPVWDQDMTLGTGWTKEIDPTITDYHYLAKALIEIPDFKEKVSEYYKDIFSPMVRTMIANGGYFDTNSQLLTGSAKANYILWDYIRVGDPQNPGHIWQGATYSTVISNTKSWVSNRLVQLDKNLIIPETPSEPGQAGDVDMDGYVDSSDAVTILRWLAGLPVGDADVEKYGDFDGDGVADSSDAVAILRMLAGLKY